MIQEVVRVTKKFTFEMAHALMNHDGLCKNIHGHSYKLSVTLVGKALLDKNHPKNGMLIDFGDLKKIINEAVIKDLDHALVLQKGHFENLVPQLSAQFQKLIIVPFQPSCENLIIDIKNKIHQKISSQAFTLHSLKLEETASSFAEWHASDN